MHALISNIYDTAFEQATAWHEASKGIFALSEPPAGSPEAAAAAELMFHNYQIWHLLEDYKSPDSNRVLFVYDGGITHNKLRNLAIERLDELLCRHQLGTGPFNSETIGSIIDRATIWYLKELHHTELPNTGKSEAISTQRLRLVTCTHELFEEMLAGTRRCMYLDRSKNF